MAYQYTREDKMEDFDTTLYLYARALLDWKDSRSEYHKDLVEHHKKRLRLMFWRETKDKE